MSSRAGKRIPVVQSTDSYFTDFVYLLSYQIFCLHAFIIGEIEFVELLISQFV